jgi:hypothetical protein
MNTNIFYINLLGKNLKNKYYYCILYIQKKKKKI